jgi:hypothetical protein
MMTFLTPYLFRSATVESDNSPDSVCITGAPAIEAAAPAVAESTDVMSVATMAVFTEGACANAMPTNKRMHAIAIFFIVSPANIRLGKILKTILKNFCSL